MSVQKRELLLMKTFTISEGEAPLERCREWAEENCVQSNGEQFTPMVLVALEIGNKGNREYRAVTYETLFNLATSFGRTHDTQRHIQEVVVMGPCKLYCDLEYKFDNESQFAAERQLFDDSAERFIGDIVAYAKEKYNVALVPFIMVSHGTKKWSKHVIFNGTIWRNNVHCIAFMRDVVKKTIDGNRLVSSYFDPGVYTPNRCFRMYRCTKWDAPDRTLVLENKINMAPEPLDERVWLDSMITCFEMKTAGQRSSFYASSLFLELAYDSFWPSDGSVPPTPIPPPLRHEDADRLGLSGISAELRGFLGKRPPLVRSSSTKLVASTNSNISLAGINNSAVNVILAQNQADFREYFHKYNAVRVTQKAGDSSLLKIECRNKYCEIAEREHAGNNIHLQLDFLTKRWRHLCYDDGCMSVQTSKKEWRPIDPESSIARICDELCDSWPYKQKVAHLFDFLANFSHCLSQDNTVLSQ